MLVLLALAISTIATADEFTKARQAIEAEQYRIAVRLLRPLAKMGDPRAQHLLGFAYYAGEGVGYDYGKAQIWLERAVAQKYTPAFAPLGQLLLKIGKGHNARGLKLIRIAVSRNDAYAQKALGVLYFVGQGGVPKDLEKSRQLLLKASAKKQKDAAFFLAYWYSDSHGKKPDYMELLKWVIIDARIGTGTAAAIHRETALKHLTESQVAEAKRRASAWLKAHGEKP
ncbi:MAG: sel1 repeat family protein [Alphaproteobacteria bacterium]|nr:sel1 repeat family protein [Alphaproteobacteria bacterium]